jgi:hypothetical protein
VIGEKYFIGDLDSWKMDEEAVGRDDFAEK